VPDEFHLVPGLVDRHRPPKGRHAVLAGALIALALVPAAALVGAGLAAGEAIMALEALRRVGLDVLLVIVLGGAVVLLKQHLIHHNRRHLT